MVLLVTQHDECASYRSMAWLKQGFLRKKTNLISKKPHTKGHILHNSIDMKYPESRLVVARGSGERGAGNNCFLGMGCLLGVTEKVLELDRGLCTTL